MDLGNIFKGQEKKGPEYFWSLVISRTWVRAAIWRVVGQKTEVSAEGTGASWEEGNKETLIQAADSTLSAVAGNFKDEAKEPSKVVFGLPPSWIDDGSIKPERLELLKKLSRELELSPAGFVILPEAIVHYLKAKEGAPPNIVLIGIDEDSIDVSLVENGRIQGTAEVGRSMSLGADVAEGLVRLSQKEQYPSRIILYNHKTADLEEAKQNLLESDWEESKIKFLHTPKVEALDEDVALSAVSLAGGAEVGHAKTVALPSEEEPSLAATAEPEGDEEEREERIEQAEELRAVEPEELGFLAGEDAELAKPELEQEPLPPKTKEALFSPLVAFFKNISLPRIRIPLPHGGRGVLGVAVILLLALFLLGGLGYWYLPKANVTIYVAPKNLDKEVELAVEPGLTVINREKAIIPGREVQVAVSGEKTTATSGTRTVGEKAKGEVTIYRIGPPLTLPAGAVLESSNGLRFTLDESTSVATGSSPAKPSETPTAVTAEAIGAQYNLAADTEFSVGNFSKFDLVGENKEAFSGGSSREVAAVSEKDRDLLEKELTEELKENGLADLKTRLSQDEILIGSTLQLESEKRDFSHKTGEEAGTLKLSLQGTLQALVVPKEALNAFLMSQLERDVPQGYILRQEQIKTEFKQHEEEEDKFTVKVNANLLPQVKPDEIAREIAGKYPEVAKDYLSSIPGFTRAEMSFNIKFLGRLHTLPRLARNIVIEVAAER